MVEDFLGSERGTGGKKQPLLAQLAGAVFKLHPHRLDLAALHKFCQANCTSIANPLHLSVKKDLFPMLLEAFNNFRCKFVTVLSWSTFPALLHGLGVQSGISTHLANGMNAAFERRSNILKATLKNTVLIKTRNTYQLDITALGSIESRREGDFSK